MTRRHDAEFREDGHALPRVRIDEPGDRERPKKDMRNIPAAEGRNAEVQSTEMAASETAQKGSTENNPEIITAEELTAIQSGRVNMAQRKERPVTSETNMSEVSENSDLEVPSIQQLLPQALELADVSTVRRMPRFPAAPVKPCSTVKVQEPQSSSASDSDTEDDPTIVRRNRFSFVPERVPWDIKKLVKVAVERPHLKPVKACKSVVEISDRVKHKLKNLPVPSAPCASHIVRR